MNAFDKNFVILKKKAHLQAYMRTKLCVGTKLWADGVYCRISGNHFQLQKKSDIWTRVNVA